MEMRPRFKAYEALQDKVSAIIKEGDLDKLESAKKTFLELKNAPEWADELLKKITNRVEVVCEERFARGASTLEPGERNRLQEDKNL